MKKPEERSPMALLREALLRIADLEAEVDWIMTQLDIADSPLGKRRAETANKIAFEKALDARHSGDKFAMRKFFSAGGTIPKASPYGEHARAKREVKQTDSTEANNEEK